MNNSKTFRLESAAWHGEEVLVNVKFTPKTITITPISQKPHYELGKKLISTDGCIDQLWDDGKIVIKYYAPPKVCRHAFFKNGDGTYTLYPNREGVPFELIPVQKGEGV